jgi:hypothetical protein
MFLHRIKTRREKVCWLHDQVRNILFVSTGWPSSAVLWWYPRAYSCMMTSSVMSVRPLYSHEHTVNSTLMSEHTLSLWVFLQPDITLVDLTIDYTAAQIDGTDNVLSNWRSTLYCGRWCWRRSGPSTLCYLIVHRISPKIT